ncbi:MAG: glutamyl-tRNA reductase [Candidatus Omnitrophota bacterium]|jgi:glutamyl-tRNA reductase
MSETNQLDQFKAWELTLERDALREATVNRLRAETESPLLVLATCQRLEVYGRSLPDIEGLNTLNEWSEARAIERFARIAAGLESRILGELEVMGQVRQAYKDFHLVHGSNKTELDRIFQQAVSLGRRARKESGIDANLTSLGGLAARQMVDRMGVDDPVAVIGSGSLASSVARYLGKRGKMPIRVASRCPDNALNLAMEVGGFATGLNNLMHLMEDVAGVITATAAPHPVLFAEHVEQTRKPLLLIDLGEPADCCSSIKNLDHVEYQDLLAVEELAQTNSGEREARAEEAGRLITRWVQEKFA